ncbi:MAG: SAM-dependent methyltransferase [Chromatiales bacterium 21-64-14]|nr:MAG: SAM-dependent methyltransferase [Chromatiales bacterium 21-64-14]HQU15698.1 class I SAM-dependent methyltransferase [Gammaproteobacteria bacterium]
MNINSIKSAYRRYARVYDALFGPIFHPARKLIVEALDTRPGERVLEVGVGTGLSLPLYPADARVVGIDISKEMLDKARQRVERGRLSQVEAVLEMDAEDMRFADNTFDKVVAMYVVSVVPDPARLVDEMRRVCKPGGEIFIVNHFRSRHPLLGASEEFISPLSNIAGFRPDMDLDDFLEATQLDVVEACRANLFGYWKVLRCRSTLKEPLVA